MRIYFLMIAIFVVKIVNAETIIYPAPKDLQPSQLYHVFIDGKETFVYDSPVPAAFCGFEMKGGVDVVIKVNKDIKWVDVRPLSCNIKPVFKDSIIQLHLDKPVHLSIEINGSIKTPLFLFADPLETNVPSKTDKNVLFFEAGKSYHPGIITLKDNETLYVQGGAFVTAVIDAQLAKNIRICGHGILNGTYNNDFNNDSINAGNFPQQKNNEGKNYHRFINLADCEDVTIQDVTLFNSTSWEVVPIHCNHVRISNIKIISDNASDDGIDIVRSKNVLIDNCFIRTKDDCIAIKATMNYPKTEGVDSVLVKHCVLWNAQWGNGFEIGFELNASELKNISFINSDIIHVEAGATISIHNAGTAAVSNIVCDNIRIEDSRQKLFDFAIFRSQYSIDGTRDESERKRLYLNGAWDGVLVVPENEKSAHAKYRGKIENVLLKNIQIVDGGLPFSIFCGYDQAHAVSNIKIENLSVHGSKIKSIRDAKFYLEDTKNIALDSMQTDK